MNTNMPDSNDSYYIDKGPVYDPLFNKTPADVYSQRETDQLSLKQKEHRDTEYDPAEGNILPSLYPSEAMKLRKKIAQNWNSKRTAKQLEEDVFYTYKDVLYASIDDVVRYSNAKAISERALRYRVSQRIVAATNLSKTILVCKNTGINAHLDIPRIPGFYMPYENPLSDISNCRSIAKRGFAYLSKLDTQVLAGILIIMAEDYSLFDYSPFETGASKNALIRSCGKQEIIKAILFIEEKIHSENYSYLPRLSFHVDTDLKQGIFESRISNWLKIIQKELETPTIVYDAPAPKSTYKKIADAKKAVAEQNKIERKAKLSQKQALAEAVILVKGLYKDSLISKKLKDFLISTCEATVFDLLDSSTKSKIAIKLATLPIESRITSLIKLFEQPAFKNSSDIEIEDAPSIQEEIVIQKKTAFELQNSREVILAEKARILKEKEEALLEEKKETFIERMLDPVPYDTCLLLTMDTNKTNGYKEILTNGKDIPGPRYQLQAVREAFDKVKNYKNVEVTKTIIGQEELIVKAENGHVVETSTVAMTPIGDGFYAPTVLWNSMSVIKQAVYKRKLMANRSK